MQLTKRQQQIISTSANIIAQHGVKGLTVKAIASEMKLTEPALYRHFSKKQDILQTLIECYGEILQESFQSAKLEKTGLEQILQYLKHRDTNFSSTPEWARLSFCEEIFHNDIGMAEPIRTLFFKVRQELQGMLALGQADGSVRNDLPTEELYHLVFGGHRQLLWEWCYHTAGDYDYAQKSAKLRQAIRKLLVTPTK